MAKRGICFDLDGTLIDSGPGGLVRLCEVAKILNLPMNEKIQARLVGMWGQHPSSLIKTAWPDTDIGRFYKQYEDLDIAEPWSVFPGTREALNTLDRYYYLSILTNRNLRTVAPQLVHNELMEFFNFVTTPESSGSKKPDPKSMDPIFKWYEQIGISKDEIIIIGDRVEDDWKLAQALGLEFYAVASGGMDTKDKFLSAGVPENHILDSVADLPHVLLISN